MGPPSVPPNWFCRRAGFTAPLKKFLASSAEFRKNSYADPWKELPPDLVAALIVAEA